MKHFIFNFLLSVILPSFIIAQNLSEEGTLRITFQDFQYFSYPTNPPGGDWRSYNKLGDLTTYVVSIFPAKPLRQLAKVQRELGTRHMQAIGWSAGRVNINSPKKLYSNNDDTILVNRFKSGYEITIGILNENRPSYVNIPLAPGDYFIYYSLFFQHPKIRDNNFVFPNYNGLDGTNNFELEWGAPYIEVSEGNVVDVIFEPSWKCINSAYMGGYNDDDFRNCEEFYRFIDYLKRIGLL